MLRLDEPLTMVEKMAIVDCFWRANPPTLTMNRYEPYFEFYNREMRALSLAFDKKDSIYEKMAAKTHEDLRLIVCELAKDGELDLSGAITKIKSLFPRYTDDDAAIRLSIDLALRLWLFLNTREPEFTRTVNIGNAPSKLSWECNSNDLKTFVRRQFPFTFKGPSPPGNFLHGNLTAHNLHRLYGITIRWTDFLPKHLHYDFTNQSLYVFPHKTCLLGMLNSSGKAFR